IRFGISEISWMLPKILRMRRCLVLVPLDLLRGASIALVAMCFPALCEDAWDAPPQLFSSPRPDHFWSACPAYPLQCVGPVRRCGPCPGEDGKSSGRTSTCGQSRYVWISPI